GPTAPVPTWLLTPNRQPAWKLVAARALDLVRLAALWALVAWTAGIALLGGTLPALTALRRQPRAVALFFFIALTVVETWPLASDPAHLSRNDNGDAVLNEWVLAWIAHTAPRDPLRLFDGNAFYPEHYTVAYAEAMIVQSAMAAPIQWLGGSPVLA